MFSDYPDVVSVNDLAKMLNIGTVLSYKLVKTKKIKSRKIGREYKILKSDIFHYLDNSSEKESE